MIKNIIISSLLITLIGCSQNVESQPTTTNPTSSPSANVSNTGTNDSVKKDYKYELPLKLSLRSEDTSQSIKTLFEVKDNVFSYNMNSEIFGENIKDEIKEIKLTTEQSEEIKKMVKDADLAKLAQADQKVPEGSPQTTELRSIFGVTINVDGKDRLFEQNDRNYIHTENYRTAIMNLRKQIEAFKEKLIAKNIEINKEFDAKIGDSVIIKSESISLNILSLKEESRCPSDVQCIQAGQAVFNLSFISQGKTEDFTLSTMRETEKTIGNYIIKLIKVIPSGFKATQSPKSSDYVLTLKIEKK